MIPLEVAISFFGASVILGLAPGPDNIFVLTQSAVSGISGGLMVTLGLCTGLLVHTTAVALGVAALFEASPILFNTLKLIGAAYLLYLAWLAFRASSSHVGNGNSTPLGLGALYRRGIIMNVTNAKVSIFFLAFLPQFSNPERGPLTIQLFLLGGIFILATILVFGTIAMLAGSAGQKFMGSPRSQKLINRLAGLVFVTLSVSIVFF